jgi:transposase-like protein
MRKIVHAFGSVAAVAEALGITPHAVSNWRRRGIPDAQKWRILAIARERGLPLDGEDLGLPACGTEARAKPQLAKVA